MLKAKNTKPSDVRLISVMPATPPPTPLDSYRASGEKKNTIAQALAMLGSPVYRSIKEPNVEELKRLEQIEKEKKDKYKDEKKNNQIHLAKSCVIL